MPGYAVAPWAYAPLESKHPDYRPTWIQMNLNVSPCLRILTGSVLLLFGLIPPLCAAVVSEFYVAPRGRDDQPGTEARPFASLEKARDAARGVDRSKLAPNQAIVIHLRGGDYFRTGALLLEAADSGTADHPVRWEAYRNESPRLLGGIALNKFSPVSNPAPRARFQESARAHIVESPLSPDQRARLGSLHSRGFARPTTPAHSELFFRGTPLVLARWPNLGSWEKIAGFPATSGKGDEHGGNIGELPGGFFYEGDRPSRWENPKDVWVHGYWAWDWANSYEQISHLDRNQHLIATEPPYANYGFRKGQRIFFLNVMEELDEPGEWFLDPNAGVVYLWPPSSLEGAEVLLSLVGDPLLRLNQVHDTTFEGLIFEASRGTGIEVNGGTRNLIRSCLLQNLGNLGVVFEGGQSNEVVACNIYETGDGGVSANGGDRQTLTPANHRVENCHFRHQGRWSKCYVPAILFNGVGMVASHNLIEEHPHCAILFNGNDHLVEYNEIHHIALETGDVGAIYTGRDYTYRGNRIRHNFIHHTGGVGMGSMGVYMDDCVSGTEIYGNLFYQVHWAVFLGGGRDHIIENNLLVDCDPAIRVDGRGLDPSPVWHNMVFDTMKKQLAAVPAELYRSRYPAIKPLDDLYAHAQGIAPEGNRIERNVCVGKWLEASWHATMAQLIVGTNWVMKESPFLSSKPMDFRLPSSFAPFHQGFKPIEADRMGLVKNMARERIPKSVASPLK